MENDVEESRMHDRFMSHRMENLRQQFGRGVEVVTLARKGAEFLERRGIKVCYKCIDHPPKRNPYRTVLCADLGMEFYRMGFKDWEANRRCPHDDSLLKMIGDAILKVGRRRIAIDISVAIQQKSFYENRFHKHQNDPNIDLVLYFVGWSWMRDFFLPLTKHCDKIYFVHMGDFFLNKDRAWITSFRDGQNFQLRDILKDSYNTRRESIFSLIMHKFFHQFIQRHDQSSKELNHNKRSREAVRF